MEFYSLIVTSLLLVSSLATIEDSSHRGDVEVSYSPAEGDPRFVLLEGHEATINVTFTGILGNISVTSIESENPDFFVVIPTEKFQADVENGTASFPVQVRGMFIGVSPLVIHVEHAFTFFDDEGRDALEKEVYREEYRIRCGILPTIWNTIFTWSLTVWLVVSYVTMGAKIDLDAVWSKFRRPFGVTIGIVCQFGIMPILAFILAKVIPMSSESAIGLLIEGSCPGGWLSNVFALMMDVDFVLSITMTFCSSCMALAMMPFNMFLYARPFVGDSAALKTPYKDICIQLALMMVPVMIGMFILRKYPRIAKKMTRALKPISMGLIVISLTLGVPALSYIFVTPFITYVAASLLPLIGGVLGFSIAKLLRRGYPEAFTIAFETGVQNSLLASVVARFSYPYPENYLIARLPLLTAILTIIQGTILIAIYVIYSIATGRRVELGIEEPIGYEEPGYELCDQHDGTERDLKMVARVNNNPNGFVDLSTNEVENEEEKPAVEEGERGVCIIGPPAEDDATKHSENSEITGEGDDPAIRRPLLYNGEGDLATDADAAGHSESSESTGVNDDPTIRDGKDSTINTDDDLAIRTTLLDNEEGDRAADEDAARQSESSESIDRCE